MYRYPSNLREKARLGLWTLKDVVILTVLILVSILALAKIGFMLPLVATAFYMLLSANVEGMSIKDYLVYIFRFCISGIQYYEWLLE